MVSNWMGDHSSLAVDAVIKNTVKISGVEKLKLWKKDLTATLKKKERKIHSMAQVAF